MYFVAVNLTANEWSHSHYLNGHALITPGAARRAQRAARIFFGYGGVKVPENECDDTLKEALEGLVCVEWGSHLKYLSIDCKGRKKYKMESHEMNWLSPKILLNHVPKKFKM